MSFDWWTLLLQIVNFLILVWLLRRFLYRPVLAVIAKRRELTEGALAAAADTRAQAETEKERLDHTRVELDETRQAMLDAARKEAEAKREAIMADAEKRANALIAEANIKATEARAAEAAGLKAELATAAVAIARRIVSQTADHNLDAVFRSRILEKLDALGDERTTPMNSGLAAGAVNVSTAEALDEAEKAAWRQELRTRLPNATEIAFSVDPDLVAGAALTLPHAEVRFAWADELKEAGRLLADARVDE